MPSSASPSDGPDLAGLLALALLGVRAEPAFGFADAATVEQFILANGADAAFVVGPDAPLGAARLARAGLAPTFTLGVPGDDGGVLRDPLMPDVPTLPELIERQRGARPSGALYDAWRAVSASAQLGFLLALPALTPGDLVSLWREAAIHAAPLVGAADAGGMRLLTWPEANAFAEPLARSGKALDGADAALRDLIFAAGAAGAISVNTPPRAVSAIRLRTIS